MQLAIAGESLGSINTLPEILEIFAGVGVKAIELWPENVLVLPGKELLHPRLYQNRDIGRAAAILSGMGCVVPAIAFGAGFDAGLAADQRLFAAQLRLAVETAAELGAGVVNCYCYHLAMGENPPLARLQTYFNPAIDAAERLGVTITLENEAHDATRSPEGMRALVEAMNSPRFRTNFDATNYYQAGYEPFPYAYEVLRDLIAYVHIKDGCFYHPEFGHDPNCKGGGMTGLFSGRDIYYPVAGDGAVNLAGLLQRLSRDGYGGWCTLEPHTTPDRCLAYYRAETAYLRGLGYFPRQPK